MMEALDPNLQPPARAARTLPYMDTEFKRYLFDLAQIQMPSWQVALLVGSTVSAIDTITTRHGLRYGYTFRKCLNCSEYFGSEWAGNRRCYRCLQATEGMI